MTLTEFIENICGIPKVCAFSILNNSLDQPNEPSAYRSTNRRPTPPRAASNALQKPLCGWVTSLLKPHHMHSNTPGSTWARAFLLHFGQSCKMSFESRISTISDLMTISPGCKFVKRSCPEPLGHSSVIKS